MGFCLWAYARKQKPEHERSFSEEAEGDIPRIQILGQYRGQSSQPSQASERHHHAQDPREEGRPEDEVAGDKTIDSVEDEGDVDVSEVPFECFKGETHEVEGCSEESEIAAHRLEYLIEEQGDGGEAEDGNESRGVEHPAVDEGFGEHSS